MEFAHTPEEGNTKPSSGGVLETFFMNRAAHPQDSAFERLARAFHFINGNILEKTLRKLAALQQQGIERDLPTILYEDGILDASQIQALLDVLFLRSELFTSDHFVAYHFAEGDNSVFMERISLDADMITSAVKRQGELESQQCPKSLDEVLHEEFGCLFTPSMLSFCLDLRERLAQQGVDYSILAIATAKNWLAPSIEAAIPGIYQKKLSLHFDEFAVTARAGEDAATLLGQLAIEQAGLAPEKVKQARSVWQALDGWGITLWFCEVLFYLQYLSPQTIEKLLEYFRAWVPSDEELRLAEIHLNEQEQWIFDDLQRQELLPKEGLEVCQALHQLLKDKIQLPLCDLMIIQGYLTKAMLYEFWMQQVGEKLITAADRPILSAALQSGKLTREKLRELLLHKARHYSPGEGPSLASLLGYGSPESEQKGHNRVATLAQQQSSRPSQPAKQAKAPPVGQVRKSEASPAKVGTATPAIQNPAICQRVSAALALESGELKQLGHFEILAKIGHGGMGQVYKARRVGSQRIVALKTLASKYACNPESLARFQQEASIAKKLDHVNIVKTYEVGAAEGVHYLVMEYIAGESVFARIQREGRLQTLVSARIILQVAKALAYANQQGLIHRDIKPGHFLIADDGTVKLCDFGLAKTKSSNLTELPDKDIKALGTPAYISPEQVQGESQIDIRSDIYSLGASFYHMLVGEAPYPADSPVDAATKHLTEAVPWTRDKRPDVSIEISNIIKQMMAKKPADRFQTPEELIVRLEKLLNIPVIRSHPAIKPVVKPSRTKGWFQRLFKRNP